MDGSTMNKVNTRPRHYELMRDDARRVEFYGVEVAAEESEDSLHGIHARAAVYRTVGGRFVSEYTTSRRWRIAGEDEAKWEVGRAKVADFDTLEDAAEWFRPGPITTALLELQDHRSKGDSSGRRHSI
jgi:hypothetical protein